MRSVFQPHFGHPHVGHPQVGWPDLLWALFFAVSVLGCGSEDVPTGEPPPLSGSAQASEFQSPPVDEALTEVTEAAQTRGFSSDGPVWRGFLVENDSAAHEQALEAGGCYLFAAAASALVTELDLRLFGPDGAEVARDAAPGPHAAVRYCPPHPGVHYVTVSSSAGTGLFGVKRFRGPSGVDVAREDLFLDSVRAGASTATP